MRIHTLIEHGAGLLKKAKVSLGHGTQNFHDEAAWLVLWSLGLDLNTNTFDDDQELSQDLVDRALGVIKDRIVKRIPAAYITGEAWLQGVPFFIDQRSIVPRSLIAECLVSGGLDYWLTEQTEDVLDLCTGNASLAVICALLYPEVRVDAMDISPEALQIAEKNLARHRLGERINLIQSNCLEQARGPYDLILCNPPYVTSHNMSQLPPEYCAEPALALHGGADGMDFIKRFLVEVPPFLKENSVIVLEVGHERENFLNVFPRLPCIWLETSQGEDQVVLITQRDLFN
jgi:ribosomal protein L3 glutamine methyltransferase